MKLTRLNPIWVLIVLSYFFIFVLPHKSETATESYVIYSFFLNTILSSYFIFADPRPYSLNKIFWLFNFSFLSFIPVCQYELKVIPWGNNINDSTYLIANIIILLSFIVFKAVNYFFSQKGGNAPPAVDRFSQNYLLKFNNQGRVIFLGLCALMVAIVGFENLWIRSSMREATENSNNTLSLLFDQLLRGCILYYTLCAVVLFRRRQIGIFWFTVTMILSLLVNFPLSTARFYVAAFYMSLAVAFNSRLFRSRNGFTYVFLVMLTVIFPLIGLARYSVDKINVLLEDPQSVFRNSFLAGDFDTYTSFCRAIQYVSDYGTTSGKQLLSVLLFFVPRSVWPGKAVGSGAFIYGQMRYEFTNISCPFIAEGYINFGFAGSMIFIAALAWLVAVYDNFYWRAKSFYDIIPINYYAIYYCVFLGLLFFMLRGDLLFSFSIITGLFVAGYVFNKYLVTKITLK